METKDQMEIWRQQAIAGTLSDADMQRAVDSMRAGRLAAAASAAAAKAKQQDPTAADDLLQSL